MGCNLMEKMKLKIVLICAFCFVLSGCGLLDADVGVERDRAERKEILEGLFVTYWRGAKISVRSIPIDASTETIDFEKIRRRQQENLGFGKHLSRIYDWEDFLRDAGDSDEEGLSAKEFMELAQELYSLADNLEHIDEDSYPTFIEILHHSSRILQTEPVEIPAGWNDSMEHWMFALVMETKFGFGSWKTYELERVLPRDLATTDYRIAANLHKGIDRLRNEWYHLADEAFSQAIVEASGPEFTLSSAVEAQIKNSNDRRQLQLFARACAYLFRGFSRHQSGDDELSKNAIADIEAALTGFRDLGIENELVWMGQAYVYVRNDEKDKAIASLNKLEESILIGDKEKDLIADVKEHIQNRDPGGALNYLTDKVFMYKLGLSYAMSYAEEIQWLRLLEKTEQGRVVLERFTELEQTLEKAKVYLDLDNLKRKGRALYKEFAE